jgi:methylated-DNA-[protein]-cysteine S-methyltransferase
MEDVAGIYARESTYLDRYVQFGLAQGRVISLSFPVEPDDDAEPEHPLLDRIETYLQGAEDDFEDVTVALTLPTPEREVLESIREVPYGEQASVDQIARMTPGLEAENDDDRARIRDALVNNPAPLLVPDHRVRDGPSAAPPAVEQKLRAVEGL